MKESKVNIEEAIELRKNGLTFQEIGEYFGVSKQRVAQLTGKTNHLKQQFKLEHKVIKPKFKPKSKVCICCKQDKRVRQFIHSSTSPDRAGDLCKECKMNNKRIKRGLLPKKWKQEKKKVKKPIELSPEGLMILIKNGFARNREEALKYVQ